MTVVVVKIFFQCVSRDFDLNSKKAFTDFSAFEIGRSSDLIGFHGICAPPSYALDQQKPIFFLATLFV